MFVVKVMTIAASFAVLVEIVVIGDRYGLWSRRCEEYLGSKVPLRLHLSC